MTNSARVNGTAVESEREAVHRRDSLNAFSSLRLHWPEYLMEAGELALYLFFTCAFATLLRHPASPLRLFIVSDVSRRVLMGLAMGVTAIAIVMSPWGKQSGAHFNPGITVGVMSIKPVPVRLLVRLIVGLLRPSRGLVYRVLPYMGRMV